MAVECECSGRYVVFVRDGITHCRCLVCKMTWPVEVPLLAPTKAARIEAAARAYVAEAEGDHKPSAAVYRDSYLALKAALGDGGEEKKAMTTGMTRSEMDARGRRIEYAVQKLVARNERSGENFVRWMRDRMVEVYNERPNIDFVLCAGEIADLLDEARAALGDAEP